MLSMNRDPPLHPSQEGTWQPDRPGKLPSSEGLGGGFMVSIHLQSLGVFPFQDQFRQGVQPCPTVVPSTKNSPPVSRFGLRRRHCKMEAIVFL